MSRITFVHPKLSERGGAERKMLLIIAELIARGHKVELILNHLNKQGTFGELIPPQCLLTCLTGDKRLWTLRTAWYLLKNRPDVTVAHNHPAQFAVGLFQCLQRTAHTLWICNEVIPELTPHHSLIWKLWYFFDRYMVHHFSKRVVNSAFTAESFHRWYGQYPEVIHSGVQIYTKYAELTNHICCADFHLPERFLLTVSRIERHKNIHFIERIAQHLPEIPLVVAGTGSEFEWLKSLEVTFPNIKILGAVSEEQKFFLLYNAVAFCFLPEAEPLGVTVMEAIGAGTPVIAFNQGGPREVILHGVNGFLCDNEIQYLQYTQNIYHKTVSLSTEPSDFEGYIFEKFSNQVMVKNFSDVIEKLCVTS